MIYVSVNVSFFGNHYHLTRASDSSGEIEHSKSLQHLFYKIFILA